MIHNRIVTVAAFTIEEKLERLRIRRGDPVGTDYNELLEQQRAANDQSVESVLMRIFKTIEPHARVPVAPFRPDICHGLVAKKIIQRGSNPEDKVWLYGGFHLNGNFVQHSVLSDENNKSLADGWRTNKMGYIWQRHEGYGKPHDMLDFLAVETVGGLYDRFMEN